MTESEHTHTHTLAYATLEATLCAVGDGELQNSPAAASSCVGPLPVVNGVDVMGAGWNSFT